MKPIFPFKKTFLKEIQMLFLLEIINGSENGITAYKLDTYFGFPRTSALRILEELENEGYIHSHTITQEGREQKLFKLTDRGKQYLKELKRKWAARIMTWHEIVPPEEFGHPLAPENLGDLLEIRLQDIETKEDAIDVLRGTRAQLNSIKQRYKKRLQIIENSIRKIGEAVKKLEEIEEISDEDVRRILREFFE